MAWLGLAWQSSWLSTDGILCKLRHEAVQDEVCMVAKQGGVSLCLSPPLLPMQSPGAASFLVVPLLSPLSIALLVTSHHRKMANPHFDECLDYLSPDFEEARLMFTVDRKTDKEAALILRNLWIFSNAKAIEAWDWQCAAENEERQLQLVQAEQEEECLRTLCEEEAEQAKLDEWKKYKNKFAPIPECPLPATALLLPSQHTLNKL